MQLGAKIAPGLTQPEKWLSVWAADGEIQPMASLGTAAVKMSWCFLRAQLRQQHAGSWPQCLARGPSVCCAISSRHRGQQAQLPGLIPHPSPFWSYASGQAGALTCYDQMQELSWSLTTHKMGN